MLTVTEIRGHNEMCGGYSYTYDVRYEGKNVNDVLKEIQEFTNKDDRFMPLGDFGCKKNKGSGAWRITIDDKVYISGWINDLNCEDLYKGDGTELVASIRGSGGWYCGIDFNIYTKNYRNY